jgi:1,4-alpha-glucan branching enzyme
MQWNNMLAKSQFDDNTDNLLSYQIMNSGTGLLFLYNEWMRRTPVLTAQSLEGTGIINRMQPLRNIDKGYDFMIRYARQVSSKEMIVPANYRNSIGFVRIEF